MKALRGLAAAALAAAGFVGSAGGAVAESATLKTIQERDSLLCSGHNGSYFGFVEVNDKNEWKGLDIDLCRALAVAVLGDSSKTQIVPLSWAQRFPALQSGDVDVVIKATGWTMGRDTELGLQFSIPYFFGGAQLMTRKELGISTSEGLDGGVVCVAAGTTIERIIADHLKTIGIEHELISYEKTAEVISAYTSGRCDAYAAWGPNLAVVRATQIEGPDDHMILDDKLSSEPISAAMRQGDEDWVDIVNWMLAAVIKAEELGVTSANVADMAANPPNPTVARLLGVEPGMGERLGLRDTWARDVIAEFGNFGEIYERNLGEGSPYKLARGLNNLWSEGGVLYAPILD